MNNITLLVMAAGMGSRYGGLKQLDEVGPSGETIFDYLQEMFVDFLAHRGDELKSEFLIPSVINDLIQSRKETVHVLYSDSPWFGVTYKEDNPYVVDQIQKLINDDFYPRKLFG